MRGLLFRGKRIDNGEWIQGGSIVRFVDEWSGTLLFIAKRGDKCTAIHDGDGNILKIEEGIFYKVIPETVGQFTGLTDKNGTKIFEGDIVYATDDPPGLSERSYRYMPVVWDDLWCGFTPFADYDLDEDRHCVAEDCEVVGNVYENPRLTEGGAE